MNIASSLRALTRGGAVLCTATLAVATAAPAQDPIPADRSRSGVTLDDVLAAATKQHPLVEAARARVTAAQGARRTAGALPNPIATYQVQNAAFPGQTLQALPAALGRETSSSIIIPLEPLYQRGPRVRRADEELRAAEAAVTLARRQVALDAARAFYRVALAQVAADAAEVTRAGLERLAAYNASRVAEGVAPEGDLIRVQVELDRAATDAALADVELARARAELLPFIGIEPAGRDALDSLSVSVSPGSIAAPTLPALAQLVGRAYRQRPDLQAARARVAAAGAEATLQRTLTVRQVGATIGTKRVYGENTMIAGVSLPIPLFDQNRGEVQRATGERMAAEQEFAWAQRTVAAQVAGAYEAAQRLTRQMAALQTSFLERASETRRITLAAYEEGAASLLQVLDVSRTLGDARVTYYRALFAQRQSLLDLAMASGEDPAAAASTFQTTTTPAPSSSAVRDGGRP